MSLVAEEDTVLTPYSQTKVKVKSGGRGVGSNGTWNRANNADKIKENIKYSRFAAAYGFAENAKEIFLANPTRDKIKIQKRQQSGRIPPKEQKRIQNFTM